MFGLRWHDLYGMCVWRLRIDDGVPGKPPTIQEGWWRVSSYYGLGGGS